MPTERPPLVGEVVPIFADTGCFVVSATDPPVVSLGFLDRSRYCFFQVAPQLFSRGWVDPVPDPLLLRKSGSAGNRTQNLWICSQKLWPLDYRGGPILLGVWFQFPDTPVYISKGRSLLDILKFICVYFFAVFSSTSKWAISFNLSTTEMLVKAFNNF
jgi:hypothetical protein